MYMLQKDLSFWWRFQGWMARSGARLLRAGVVAAAGRIVCAVCAVVVVGALGAAAAADVTDAGAQEGLRVGALVALRVEADLRAGGAGPGQPCLDEQGTMPTCMPGLPPGQAHRLRR